MSAQQGIILCAAGIALDVVFGVVMLCNLAQLGILAARRIWRSRHGS